MFLKKVILSARFSEPEKNQIKASAANQGCTMSQYLHNRALSNTNPNFQTKKLYAKLCEVPILIEQIESLPLRKKFKNWRHETWQLIK